MRKSIPKKMFSPKLYSISQSNRQKGSLAPSKNYNKPRLSKAKSKNISSPKKYIKDKQKQKT